MLNNTFNGINKDQDGACSIMQLFAGEFTVKSNLLMNGVGKTIDVTGAASVAADYNAFWQNNSPNYSNSRRPLHDLSGANPRLTNPATVPLPFDEAAVW